MVQAVKDDANIRDPAFGQRLEQACDASFDCPAHGRLTWMSRELKRLYNITASVESVRRWHTGENKPRKDKADKLAELLGVDATWLYLGIESNITPRERRARNALADGAVNLVAGLIQMDGGHPAFPEEGDDRATQEHVDLYAVIRGAKYSLHVTAGTRNGDGWDFSLPANREHIVVLGVVRDGFTFRFIELTDSLIETGTGTVSSKRLLSVHLTEQVLNEGQIRSFAQRL